MALIPFLGILFFGILSVVSIAVICMLLGIFLLNQHKIGHFLAKRSLTREIEKAFPHWLMELSLLLQIDNVQVSVAKTVSHAPEVLRPALGELMKQIEKNPESPDPYLNFLKEFERPQIQAAMKMLYALSVGNGGSEREQLEELIARNQNLMNQAEELMREDALAGMYLLFLTPGAGGGHEAACGHDDFPVCIFCTGCGGLGGTMSQIIKAFTGIFFLVLLMLFGCGIVSAQMSSVYARAYKSAVVTELEDSGCSQPVIESCITQAQKDGYGLEIRVWERDGKRIAEVTLEYDYRIPILNYTSKYKLRGYAV